MRGATDVVRHLLAVQAQDAPLAAWSLAMRSRSESYAAVLAEQAGLGFVRTHVLRPTWHHVAAEDLRWLQALTGPRIESGQAARHRALGLDTAAKDRALTTLGELLGGRNALTRREIQAEFAARGLPHGGEQMGHQLATAEVRAVICGGPPRGTEHTYLLVDEVIAHTPDDDLPTRDRPGAIRRIVHRFLSGHGPGDERDLLRWANIPLTESRAAIAELVEEGILESLTVRDEAGEEFILHADPTVRPRTTREHAAYLLPTFDEVTLTYARTGFPLARATLDRSRLIAEAGGGTVVIGGVDVGLWKRTVTGRKVSVTIHPERPLTEPERDAVDEAIARLTAFHE